MLIAIFLIGDLALFLMGSKLCIESWRESKHLRHADLTPHLV